MAKEPKERLTKEEKIAKLKKARETRLKRKKSNKQQDLMKAGTTHGYLRLIQKVRAPKDCSMALRKRWRVVCQGPIEQQDGTFKICGNELTIPEMYLRRANNPKVDCGCQVGSMRSRHNQEYRIWLLIRERTRNPAHIANQHYVARGIDICDEWYDKETGFELFFREVGPRPTPEHSMDRIDNNRGYGVGNMRWATSAQQRANQGDMVAGYTEAQIIAAGYTRLEFTTLISKGADEHVLIKGKKT